MNKKLTSTIATSSIYVTIITLVGRGLGFIREVIFAATFGLSQSFEIYLVATVLPTAINIVLIVLGQNYFIPNYYKVKDKSNRALFLNQSLILFLILSLIVALLLFVFSRELIGIYVNTYSVETKNTALKIFTLYLPTIPITALVSIFFAYLQSERNFVTPILSNLIVNVFLVAAVPLLSEQIGIIVIPIFYLMGVLCQLLYLFWKVNSKMNVQIASLHFKSGINKNLGFFLFYSVVIEVIGQLFVIADRFFWGQVQKGGIAALNYSATLYQLPIVILPFAISTVLFPSLSEMIQKKELVEVKTKLSKAISMLIFLTVPIVFIFLFYGKFVVMILFQRGNFSYLDNIMTTNALSIYSMSLVFYAVYSVLNKFLFSASLLKELLIIVSCGVVIKITLNFLLVNNFLQNGLAFSTSISFIYYCFITMIVIKKNGINLLDTLLKNLFFYIANCGISLIFMLFIQNNLLNDGNIYLVNTFYIVLFFFLFLINCYIVKDKSLLLIIDSLCRVKKEYNWK